MVTNSTLPWIPIKQSNWLKPVIVTGAKVIKSIKIKPEVVDPDDVEMLQDLIITCTNEALRKVDDEQASQMGNLNIPGFM